MAPRIEQLVHLHSLPSVSWRLLKRMIERDPELQKVFSFSASQLESFVELKSDHAEKLYGEIHRRSTSEWMSYYQKKQVKLVSFFDKEYPKLLKETYDPPWVLYCKGDLNLFQKRKSIAVVGTRNPTNNGIHSLKKLLPPLIEQNWVVVSGLAYGIDFEAHKLAVDAEGHTIAVLGSGFDQIYPKAHQAFAEKIAESHLLISEYPPYRKPLPWQFPARNRIISGLSLGLLVVEAKEKSGSLITADQALEQGRDVFAVPGSILNPAANGTNRLVQQGAKLVIDAQDILDEWLK
ncbi:DNA-processing protein DprA [Halalkalibacterium ligniniphilum]|uniref:DNA-processing protein DprA n=1 Tax=Halalkalibacterium ligniniphilum TaxID=1134413 RepID=UPI000368EDD0|nr:DNA-processing protein DprA [Halalkalibacterium ligniniphilum]